MYIKLVNFNEKMPNFADFRGFIDTIFKVLWSSNDLLDCHVEKLMQFCEMYPQSHPVSIFIMMFSRKVDETSERAPHVKEREVKRAEVETNIKLMVFSPCDSTVHGCALQFLKWMATKFGATNR